MMGAFAELTAHAIESDLEVQRGRKEKAERIARVIERDQLFIVYRPIFNLASGRVVGVEALARFTAAPQRGPGIWFAEAAEVGLSVEMELFSIRKALAGLAALPAPICMTLNISPSTAH